MMATSQISKEFTNTYDLRTFTVSEHYLSRDKTYMRGENIHQGECQNAEDWPSCEEMIRRKKIGTCHDIGNASCLGEYVWLDDWGYQVADYYSNGGRNYYPRSVVYRRTVWTLNITLDSQNITFSTPDYGEMLHVKKVFPIGGSAFKRYVYRENGTVLPLGEKVRYNDEGLELIFSIVIVIEVMFFLSVMLQNA